MPARAAAVLTILVVAGTVAGCAGAADAPREVAVSFYAAIGANDGDAACAALATRAAEAVAEAEDEDEGSTCAEAILSGEVGDDLADRSQGIDEGSTRVAGRQAQVRLGTDTVFLARSGGGWVVTAVGCDPRPEQPYDCEVAG